MHLKIRVPIAAARIAALGIRVNAELELYLTDFLNRTFAGEIAKNRELCGGSKFQCAPVYHARIKHVAAVWGGTAPRSRSPVERGGPILCGHSRVLLKTVRRIPLDIAPCFTYLTPQR